MGTAKFLLIELYFTPSKVYYQILFLKTPSNPMSGIIVKLIIAYIDAKK